MMPWYVPRSGTLPQDHILALHATVKDQVTLMDNDIHCYPAYQIVSAFVNIDGETAGPGADHLRNRSIIKAS